MGQWPWVKFKFKFEWSRVGVVELWPVGRTRGSRACLRPGVKVRQSELGVVRARSRPGRSGRSDWLSGCRGGRLARPVTDWEADPRGHGHGAGRVADDHSPKQLDLFSDYCTH